MDTKERLEKLTILISAIQQRTLGITANREIFQLASTAHMVATGNSRDLRANKKRIDRYIQLAYKYIH